MTRQREQGEPILDSRPFRHFDRRVLSAAIGLAGVPDGETAAARRWGERFEIPMILLATWIVAEWYLEARGGIPRQWGYVTDWIIWVFFMVETATLAALVRDRRRYLLTNWMNLVIILGGIPVLWGWESYAAALRILRLLLILPLLVNLSRTTRRMLARNNLGRTLTVAAFIITIAGVLISGIDPAIDTPWDGVWWAWVTVTTVGYGDIVPHSPAGRLFASVLILFGIALFSLLTANFSAFLMAEEEEEIKGEEAGLRADLHRVENRLQRLEATLKRIEERLERGG